MRCTTPSHPQKRTAGVAAPTACHRSSLASGSSCTRAHAIRAPCRASLTPATQAWSRAAGTTKQQSLVVCCSVTIGHVATSDAICPAWAAAITIEPKLPLMGPDELVEAVAALAAAAAADEQQSDRLSELLPASTWLLTFRNAAAAQLPAFGADRLTSLLSALGALPLYVEASPLPIGFGTPRWALPRAVSDPESWENFLSAAADAFVDDLLRSITAAESAASAASHGRASAEVNATAAAQQAQRALLIEFARALAASKKWVMVRMDTEWVASQECEERVAAFVGKHWGALLEELRCADTDVSGTFCSSGGRSSSRRTGDAAGAPAASAAAPWEERHDACSGPLLADGVGAAAVAERGERWLRRRRHQILAAYLVRAQLQNRLQPPEHQLERFFALSAYSSGITNDYSLEDLEAIVRTLMIIGDSPSELWLMRLVDVVMERREDMGQQQLRGFVEGLRFFRTQHGSKHLRDAISVLSEWL